MPNRFGRSDKRAKIIPFLIKKLVYYVALVYYFAKQNNKRPKKYFIKRLKQLEKDIIKIQQYIQLNMNDYKNIDFGIQRLIYDDPRLTFTANGFVELGDLYTIEEDHLENNDPLDLLEDEDPVRFNQVLNELINTLGEETVDNMTNQELSVLISQGLDALN